MLQVRSRDLLTHIVAGVVRFDVSGMAALKEKKRVDKDYLQNVFTCLI